MENFRRCFLLQAGAPALSLIFCLQEELRRHETAVFEGHIRGILTG